VSGGYGSGGHPGRGYGAPGYGDDPEPGDPRRRRDGQPPRDGSVWENDQDQAGYDPPDQQRNAQRYRDQGYREQGYQPGRGRDHDSRGYEPAAGYPPPGPDAPRWPTQQPRQQHEQGPQDPRYSRDQPGPSQPGQPGQPGYGTQQAGSGGYGDWEQDQEDSSFLPGFGRRDEYEAGRARGQDRYRDDDYDGPPSWPDGRTSGDQRDPRASRDPRNSNAPGNRGGDDDYDGRNWNDRDRAGQNRSPAPRKRATRWAPRILILVIVLALVIGGSVGGLDIYHKYEARYHPTDFAGAGTGNVTVQVPSGATAFSLAPELLKLHVIASVRAFTNAAESAPATTSSASSGLEAGYYQLKYDMKASLAYAALLNNHNLVTTTVTIPEGKRAVDVIAIVSAKTKIPLKNFQAALKNVPALGLPSQANGKPEGYLFPATYAISPHETALQILQAMVQRYDVEADGTDLAAAAKTVGLTPTQLIIEASLAQAEGGSVADYPKIAEVIHNRLANGMKLQFDSTVLYGLGKYAVSATFKQINTPGPYNTYLNTGLPPGPISNPGDAAIQGILHPDNGDWLYFLTKPGGKSQFSASPLTGQ
jgi:UPF0755 protein